MYAPAFVAAAQVPTQGDEHALLPPTWAAGLAAGYVVGQGPGLARACAPVVRDGGAMWHVHVRK